MAVDVRVCRYQDSIVLLIKLVYFLNLSVVMTANRIKSPIGMHYIHAMKYKALNNLNISSDEFKLLISDLFGDVCDYF